MSVREVASSEQFAGRYELLETLGAGGVGTVYRARDGLDGREVAIKLLRGAPERNRARQQALFEREFQTLARLKHPRIIEVYEYGVAGDTPYYSMELLAGDDLQRLSPLPVREACSVLRDVASSLALLHTQRLLHRDVSPRNVRRTAGGRAKLIDFGALASFGVAEEIIGTPMCIAPEVLQRSPLDQRTDLFALGALAYWAVTGRPAYAALHVRDLPNAWHTPPPPPSRWNAEVPASLDTLIMSLLHLDPLARPASAAAVIERLSAIAELPADDDAGDRAGEIYLGSGRLVGRDAERAQLKARMLRALDGHGGEVTVVGPPGIGRSRLLREAALDATLSGFVAIRAEGERGVEIALARQLLETAPEIARRAAGEHAGLLDHLEGGAPPHESFQPALAAWIGAIARHLPILIAVDDLQAAGAETLTFLLHLSRAARERRLLIVVAVRTGMGESQPAPQGLRQRSYHLRLRPLDRTACEELFDSLFGDVAGGSRVAQLLYEHSGGNPRQFLALSRRLVHTGIAHYADGAWVLPFDLARGELTEQPDAVAHERLTQLGAAARELANALSIYRTPLSVEHCRTLLPDRDERELYAVLDELVAEQILVAAQGTYRFEHASLREAIERRLDPEARKLAHARAAELQLAALQAAGDAADVGARVEAAWHLLAAGEESEGADLLAEAQPELLRSSGAREAAEGTVRALETALAVYARERRPPVDQARILFSLVSLAFFVDRRIAREYGERALALGGQLTGLALARWLPGRWGLRLARWIASFRVRRAERQATLGAFCALVPPLVEAHAYRCDVAAVARLAGTLAPLRWLAPEELGHVVHDYAEGQVALGRGHEAEARERIERALRALEAPELQLQLEAAGASRLRGGMLFSLGLIELRGFGAAALERARALDTVRGWESAAGLLRLLHHAQRGESEAAGHYRERVELDALRGSSWQAELLVPVTLLDSEVLAQDPIAVRRIWEQIERGASEVPAVDVYADAAQAAYLALRGEHAAAIRLYERVLPRLPPRERAGWSNVRAHFAEALNSAGDHARAKAVVTEALPLARLLELERQLALAEAGLGEYARAVARLDRLLAKHGVEDQPLWIGALHKARAEVALRMGDESALELHLAELNRRFRGTRNPALIAQCERLAEQAVRQGLRPAAWRQ